MPPETNPERTNPTTSGAKILTNISALQSELREPNFAGATAVVYKMRCPSCQRLYSVNASVIHTVLASPTITQSLQFQCQSEACKSRFEVSLVGELDLLTEILPTREFPSVQAPAPTIERSRSVSEPAPLMGETPCPKCQAKNSLDATECRQCGVVFAKLAKAEKFERLEDFAGRRELADMWAAILEDYENSERHERFVEECYRNGCLGVAASRYARILVATPNEEIAKTMRRRIVGLSSFKSETAQGPGKASAIKPGFRIPKMNDLILVLGGALMTMGFMLPGCRDLVGLGAAAVALGIGVRFFLSPKPY